MLLGAAARLRGAHERTDHRVRELVLRCEAALGAEEYASAYAQGWDLTPDAAAALTDPSGV